MRLNIIDPVTMELLDVLTQYQSVQWSPTYNTPDGTFQIVTATEYLQMLQPDRLVENTEEPDHVGVIKRVQTVKTNEREYLQVDGIFVEQDIFSRRCVKGWVTYFEMLPSAVLQILIGESLRDPVETERRVAELGDVSYNIEVSEEDIFNYSADFPNMGEEVYTLLQMTDAGVRSHINRETNKIDIEFYEGTDRTYGGEDPVIFSSEWGTITEATYTLDTTQNFNSVCALGEDHVFVQVERERAEGERLLEKSIDISSDVPWPTYPVEHPNDEDGGSYYRYKKVSPENMLTNRDVWEKYEVQRRDEEITYKTLEDDPSYVPGTAPRESVKDFTLKNGSMSSKIPSALNGSLIGSAASTEGLIKAGMDAAKNSSASWGGIPGFGGGTTQSGSIGGAHFTARIGYNFKPPTAAASISLDRWQEPAVIVDGPAFTARRQAEKQGIMLMSAPVAKIATKAKAKAKASVKGNVTNSSSGTKGAKAGLAVSGGLAKSPGIEGGGITAWEGEAGELHVESGVASWVETVPQIWVEHTYTQTTYETGEFLEYTYVNIGQPPSPATKIVQGSVASGDVIYYENFEDVRVLESEYKEVLTKKAIEYLKTFVTSEALTVTPYSLAEKTYRHGYNLGDIVTAKSSKLGYATDVRITAVTEVWDSKGYSVALELGDNIPSLTNRIKLLAKGGN